MLQNFASSGEWFDKDGLLIRDRILDNVEIFERQRQKLCERAMVRHDAKNGPSRAVRLQATFAKIASGAVTVSRTGNVNFPAHSPAQPLVFFRRRNAMHPGYFTDEFMARNAAKALIPAKQLDIGVANSGKPNADQRPSAPQPGQWFFDLP